MSSRPKGDPGLLPIFQDVLLQITSLQETLNGITINDADTSPRRTSKTVLNVIVITDFHPNKPTIGTPPTGMKGFAFAKAGAQVFGASGTDDCEGNEEHDPHYEPIVPLPKVKNNFFWF